MSIFYDLVSPEELEDAHRIEANGYPEDEAGSLETFRYRQSQAPELFLGAYVPAPDGRGRKLVGYVCATLSPDDTLTHESMSTHVPGAASICIHSVCIDAEHRHRQVGLNLVKEFVARAERAVREDNASYQRILLIAHEELRGFYEKAGFQWAGLSSVVHGSRPWYEMRKEIQGAGAVPAPPETTGAQTQQEQAPSEPQELPAGLWEALQRSSTRSRPVARLLTSFPNAVKDVVSDIGGDGTGGLLTNKYDLLCPRLGCGSVILKSGVASWVERESVQLEPPGQRLPESLGALPAPPATAQWWLVKPNAMAFENIGFSRAVQATGPGGRKLKLLACAECDLGPLGWCEEGGTEFWLACNRVGYRA
ncbi:acyl-CoA N-acyltransferase [Trametes cingulata]|nr:acyl-CoA N-acyltransferase [Trametes cingulata]